MTLVTCLYDLAARESNPERRTIAEYLTWADFVCALDADIVFFIDPGVEPAIRAMREQRGLLARTVIEARPFESLSSYALLERAVAARSAKPLLNGNPTKDTPLYAVLGWSKFEILASTLDSNPFKAEHFAWIDLGLAHVALSGHLQQDRPFSDTPTKIRLLQMRPLARSALADRPHFLSYLWSRFAGGLMTGQRGMLGELCTAIGGELCSGLSDGFAPIDEQLLELVVASRPELFDCYHGDYTHVLENYRQPRGSAENLLLQLRCWRASEDWQPASELAERIVSSCQASAFEAAPATLAQLLEECFVATFYAHRPDQTAARTAAALYVEYTRRDPDFREEFLRHELRVRTNFSFLDEPVKL